MRPLARASRRNRSIVAAGSLMVIPFIAPIPNGNSVLSYGCYDGAVRVSFGPFWLPLDVR